MSEECPWCVSLVWAKFCDSQWGKEGSSSSWQRDVPKPHKCAHCYVTDALERMNVEYFFSSLRKFFQLWTGTWNRVPRCHPSNVHLQELRPYPSLLTIFEMKAVSVPRMERELSNREADRLYFMIMALLPWSYRKVFRLCSSEQELICQKHLAWTHLLSSSHKILKFWSAHGVSPVCGRTFSIIGREYLLILWRTDPLCDFPKRPNIQLT